METMETAVWYHSNCCDGFGAAWAAWRHFGEEAEYVAVSYGAPPPSVEGVKQLYILDFSYSAEILHQLAQKVPHITLLDHHKTAEADLREFFHQPALSQHLKMASPPGIFVHFDMEHSGAVLAFEYFTSCFYPEQMVEGSEVDFCGYIEDRDLWKFEIPSSREFNAALRSYPFDFQLWDEIAKSATRQFELAKEGATILRHQDQMVDMMCQQAVLIPLEDYVVPCVNATCYFSEVGDKLCELFPEAKFSAYYLDRADGKRQWGLRSRSGFDCSVVAKQYGGGGHPGAAGFVTDIENTARMPVRESR